MNAPAQTAAISTASKSHLPSISGWQPVCYAVLADGALAMMTTDVDLVGEHQRINAAFRASTSPKPPSRLGELCAKGNAKIWTITPTGAWVAGPIFPLETPFPQFDMFGDGRWLVVASRTREDANARVLNSDGKILKRLMLGDGIEHVAVDGGHRIWVGWFDEGMFGNDDWRVPGQEWPPSSNGVACFAEDGDLLPLPHWPADAGTIADCYALNVTGAGVWVCPYTDFPLVHFALGEPTRWWRVGIVGAKAVAIDGAHAVLAGGYTNEANRLALVGLDGNGAGENASVLSTWHLPLRRLPPSDDNGAAVWHHPSLLTGRGDTIHLVDDGIWYRWRVRDLTRS